MFPFFDHVQCTLTNGKLPAVCLNIISIWLNEAWKTSHKNKQHNIIQMNIKRIFSSTLMVFDHVSEWTIFSKNVQWKTQFYPWIDSITWESTFSTMTRLQVGGTFLTNGFNFINLKTYKSRYPVCAFHVISVISNSINFNACSDYQCTVTKSKTRIVEKNFFFPLKQMQLSLWFRERRLIEKFFLLSSIICYFYFKIKGTHSQRQGMCKWTDIVIWNSLLLMVCVLVMLYHLTQHLITVFIRSS